VVQHSRVSGPAYSRNGPRRLAGEIYEFPRSLTMITGYSNVDHGYFLRNYFYNNSLISSDIKPPLHVSPSKTRFKMNDGI